MKKDHDTSNTGKHTMTNSTQALDSTLYLFKIWDAGITTTLGQEI